MRSIRIVTAGGLLLAIAAAHVCLGEATKVTIEAENFTTIQGATPETNFAKDASGGSYVCLPKGPMTLDQPIQAMMGTEFEAVKGLCLFKVRYRILNRGSDSFYWRVDDAKWQSFPMRAGVYGEWVWDQVKAPIDSDGTHTIWFAAREATRIDVIEVGYTKMKPDPLSRTEYKKAIASRSRVAVVVDGKLDDWRDVDANAGLVMGEADYIHQDEHYYGPTDTSAVAYIKWDQTNLYVAVVVQDDLCRNTRPNNKSCQEGDGVLVCLTPTVPERKKRAQHTYGTIVTCGDFAGLPAQIHRVKGPRLDFPRAARKTGNGYVLEFAIPLSGWPEVAPESERTVGFEICLYESDTRFGKTKRTGILAWNSLRNRMNAAECGELTFSPPTTADPAAAPGDLAPADLVKDPLVVAAPRQPRGTYAEGFGFFLKGQTPEQLQHRLDMPLAKTIFKERVSLLTSRLLDTWNPESYMCADMTVANARSVAKTVDRLAMAYLLTAEDTYADLAAKTVLAVADSAPGWIDGDVVRTAYFAKALVLGTNWIDVFLTPAEHNRVLQQLAAAGECLAAGLKAPIQAGILGLIGLALGREAWVHMGRTALQQADFGGPDDTDLAHALLFEEALRNREADSIGLEWQNLLDTKFRSWREPVPGGFAMNAVHSVYTYHPHRMAVSWLASRTENAAAAWFLQQTADVVATSSRDGDEAYTLLWLPDQAVQGTPPDWVRPESEAAWLKQTAERVQARFAQTAQERTEAMGQRREHLWKGQPFDPRAEVLKELEEDIIAEFATPFRNGWLEQGHPRLYVTDADLPFWADCMATTHRGLWERHETFGRKLMRRAYSPLIEQKTTGSGDVVPTGRNVGTMMGQMAFLYLITGDDTYGEFTKRFLLGVSGEEMWELRRPDLVHGHALWGAGIAYDYLYHTLMPSERKTVLSALQRQSTIMYRSIRGAWRRGASANNHSWIKRGGLATTACAIYEETPQAEDWLTYVRYEFEKILAIHGPDGATPEGYHMYMRYGVEWLLRYLELLYDSCGEDLYDHPWLRNNGYCFLYTLMPGGEYVANFGDNPDKAHDSSHALYRYATQYRDGYLQWTGDLMRTKFPAPSRSPMWTFLWYDPSITPTPPDTLPTVRYFHDLEMVIARSDWGPDATCFAFRCGPPMGYHAFSYGAGGYGHAHQDQNHFMLFSHGRYLVADTGYSRHKLTQEHNTILVDERGQIGEATTWFHRKMKDDELATITGFFGSPDYTYVCGDAAKAYWKELGLQMFKRHAMFIDGRILILFDDVRTDRPRRLDWLLHTPTPITVKPGNTFSTENEGAALYARMMLPQTVEHVTEPFFLRRGVVRDINGIVTIPERGSAAGHWLKCTPGNRRPVEQFLTVLAPRGADAPEPVSELCPNHSGLRLTAGQDTYWIAHKATNRVLEAGKIRGNGDRAWVRVRSGNPGAFALNNGTELRWAQSLLLESSRPVTVSACNGRLVVQTEQATDLGVHLAPRPSTLICNGQALPFDVRDGLIRVSIPVGRTEIKAR